MAETYFGMPAQAVAILMIVFGVLVIALPSLLHWLVGILLIVMGVLALVSGTGAWSTWTARRAGPPGEPPRRV